MSYCRWSCENHKSDVYVYGDVAGGVTCHVAGNKVVGEAPPVPNLLTVPIDEFVAAHKAQMAWLETAERAPLGLPHDGETFNEPDELAMVERLLALRALGYHVPEFAIEGLREDAATPDTSSERQP